MANDYSDGSGFEDPQPTEHASHSRSSVARSSDGMTRHHHRRKLRPSGEDNSSSRNDPIQLDPAQLEHQLQQRRRRKRRTSDTKIEHSSRPSKVDKDYGEGVHGRSSVSSSRARYTRNPTTERVRRTSRHESTAQRRVRHSEPERSPSSSRSVSTHSEDEPKIRDIPALNRSSRPRRSVSTRERSERPRIVRDSPSAEQISRVSVLPTVREESKLQPQRPMQRSLSVFGNLFGPPRPVVPEEIVSCLTCMDDIAASKAPLLICGHRMCHSCLRRIFTLSVTDPAHMPPKCCTDECIPIKYVQKLFDDRFKVKWNRKYHEYTTKNRIYCPAKGCGSWIPPKDITRDKAGGRKYGTCRRCKTQVCAACNGKRHKSKECPQDDTTQQFADMAKDHGWQRCYNCSATVELKEGCNHMTCRCTAQFCMICGEKWKTCDCPWFNYTANNGGFFGNMNVPQAREEIARGGNAFAQPLAYAEEMERRREQERQDEEYARRLAQTDFGFGLPRGGFGVANMVDQFLEPEFMQRAAEFLAAGANIVHREVTGTVEQPVRGNHRVFGAAAAFAAPIPNPFRRPASRTRPAPTPIQRLPEDPPVRLPSVRVAPPQPALAAQPQTQEQPQLRRSATVRSTRRPQPVANSNKAKETPKRPAVLAGVNRAPSISRVAAWRQHVTGEPAISPL